MGRATNNIPLLENMVLGIDTDFFSIYWHCFPRDDYNEVIGTLRLDSKVGLSFTYIPIVKQYMNRIHEEKM